MSLLVKPKINYIIATHALTYKRRNAGGDKFAVYALRYHMYILSKILTSESNITQITIVQPDVVDIAGYYNISPYNKIIEQKGITIEYFKVENKGISYTQYIKTFKQYPEFDYYIIMEDDWTVNLEYIDFDNILIDLYKKNFLDNIGFLNCWSPNSGKYCNGGPGFTGRAFHSSITLGILSKKTVDTFINHIPEIIGQFEFSIYLSKYNISILDMNQCGFNTRILFWVTDGNLIKDYSETNATNTFFTPVQYYYNNVRYENGLNEIYIVNNNYGIHDV